MGLDGQLRKHIAQISFQRTCGLENCPTLQLVPLWTWAMLALLPLKLLSVRPGLVIKIFFVLAENLRIECWSEVLPRHTSCLLSPQVSDPNCDLITLSAYSCSFLFYPQKKSDCSNSCMPNTCLAFVPCKICANTVPDISTY